MNIRKSLGPGVRIPLSPLSLRKMEEIPGKIPTSALKRDKLLKNSPRCTRHFGEFFIESENDSTPRSGFQKCQFFCFLPRDIVDVHSGSRKPCALSFCQTFQDMISRMERLRGADGASVTNIQKHRRCLVHFQTFCR